MSVWLSFWLRLASPFHPTFTAFGGWLLRQSFNWFPLYALTGQYKGLTRYVGSFAFYRLAGRNGVLVVLLAFTGLILRFPMPPKQLDSALVVTYCFHRFSTFCLAIY